MVNNKIIVKFQGGLGNQLFQYALYEWIKKEYPDMEVLADLSYYKIRMAHNSPGIWDIFPKIAIKRASFGDIFLFSGEIPTIYSGKGADRLDAIRKRINNRLFKNRKYVYICKAGNSGVNEARNAIADGARYLDGFWQNKEFFVEIKDTLKNRLFLPNSKDVYNGMEISEKDVAIHVRRGDYVNSSFGKQLQPDYYIRAIDMMKARISNPHFYFFSDDTEYVSKEYSWLDNKTVVLGHENEFAYVDMIMMSKFKNCIIPNSTFSLWAAYLNNNDSPCIIYPQIDFMKNKELDSWLGI